MSVEEASLEDWPVNVRIFYTTREGGHSEGPFRGFNLGLHVGDREEAVLENRAVLQSHLPEDTKIAWMDQVHGIRVVAASDSITTPLPADACWTCESGIACAVMVADCLPVLLTDQRGDVVAAVHAGWRGLAAGVLDSAVSALKVPPEEICAWLGPAIGKEVFEVGPEVRAAFITGDSGSGLSACFRLSPHHAGHYLADLSELTRLRLQRLGVFNVSSLNACTVNEPDRFFSYRRDGVTGRMACLILRDK
ncbi:peptidoglycan editing factor PgeF [Congregibacter brevis]|uniref:Purine nucleoside phosphorylase n=1 Tax=Congregibacter brevis TaxID=3081201 RepID=A0ABZ0ICD0_9GAMM|nr:peptidoglycan editing factor PgeF [Congregibacter sp. IMCC45268]